MGTSVSLIWLNKSCLNESVREEDLYTADGSSCLLGSAQMAQPPRDCPADPWRMVTNPVMYTRLLLGSYKKKKLVPYFKDKGYPSLSATVLGIPLHLSGSPDSLEKVVPASL